MKEVVVQRVKEFFEKNLPVHPKILLGFSGGVDSLALFHILITLQKWIPFELHVAHIDHGWRKESAAQAIYLEKFVNSFGISFHLHTLDPGKMGISNLEDKCRLARLQYFTKIYQKQNLNVLMLAHQADDRAETFLKRVLEGSGLSFLHGLKPYCRLHDMEVYRPLLTIYKKDLYEYIRRNQLHPIEDETNFDTKYLRAKMRVDMFPLLEKQFGKKISSSLCKLSAQHLELSDYLDRKTECFEQWWHETKNEYQFDYKNLESVEKIELRHFMSKKIKGFGATISSSCLETLLTLIKERNTSKRVMFSGWEVVVQKTHLQFRKTNTSLYQCRHSNSKDYSSSKT